MSKRTPGKWELFTDFSVWAPSENALVCVCHHGDKRLRDTREISQEEAHANARLIAAAPDFLAAAQIAIKELEAVEREIGVPSKALPLLRTAVERTI